MIDRLRNSRFDTRKITEGELYSEAAELTDYSYDNPNPVPLLYQSGYLTISGYDKKYRSYQLNYPNPDVRPCRRTTGMSTSHASKAQQGRKCEYRARGAGVRSTKPRAGLIKYGCASPGMQVYCKNVLSRHQPQPAAPLYCYIAGRHGCRALLSVLSCCLKVWWTAASPLYSVADGTPLLYSVVNGSVQ